MVKSFLKESRSKLEQKVQKLIKKQGYATFVNDTGIQGFVTEIEDGYGIGLDQFDNDLDIDLNSGQDEWYLEEGTTSSDIAQGTSTVSKEMHKRCMNSDDECLKDLKTNISGLDESPVGQIGRTGSQDADDYISDKLRSEFKRIVKKLGGKTVARKLLAEMNPGLI